MAGCASEPALLLATTTTIRAARTARTMRRSMLHLLSVAEG
jgi:hypothetical protein